MTIDPEKLEEAIKEFEEVERRWALNSNQKVLLAAARTHPARHPRYKEVEVMHVEYAFREFEALDWRPQVSVYPNDDKGKAAIKGWLSSFQADKRVAHISVTGPHKQRVPA
jgi:hypothetical protein